MDNEKGLIIYNTPDGRSKVALMARDGMVWLNQKSIAELFGTSKQNVSWHIANILKEGELELESVVKDYLTTAAELIYQRADSQEPNMGLTLTMALQTRIIDGQRKPSESADAFGIKDEF